MIQLHQLVRSAVLVFLILSSSTSANSFAAHKKRQFDLSSPSALQSRDIGDLGINCEGDWWHCYGVDGILDAIEEIVPLLSDWDVYLTGDHIACFRAHAVFIAAIFVSPNNGFCLFLQGDAYSTQQILFPDGHTVSAINGSQIKALTSSLRAHGCNGCGSIPLDTSSSNDPHSLGILTVNYVSNRQGCGNIKWANGQDITQIKDSLCKPSLAFNDKFNPYWQWSVIQTVKNNATTFLSTGRQNLPPVTLNASTLAAARQVGLGAYVKLPDVATRQQISDGQAAVSASSAAAAAVQTPPVPSAATNGTGHGEQGRPSGGQRPGMGRPPVFGIVGPGNGDGG